jgi:hypothetical protein
MMGNRFFMDDSPLPYHAFGAPLSKKRSPSEQFFTLRVAYSIVCCNANFA